MSKLFKCKLSSNIRELADKTEYLRCKSKKILENMFTPSFNSVYSEYFGYTKAEVTEMKISDFPEVMTMKINCTTNSTTIKMITPKDFE